MINHSQIKATFQTPWGGKVTFDTAGMSDLVLLTLLPFRETSTIVFEDMSQRFGHFHSRTFGGGGYLFETWYFNIHSI